MTTQTDSELKHAEKWVHRPKKHGHAPGGAILQAIASSRAGDEAPEQMWRVRYGFGRPILRDFGLVPPCGPSREKWCQPCTELMEAMGPTGIPLGVVLSGSVEVHLEVAQARGAYSRPLRILGPAESFGLFERCDNLVNARGQATDAPWALTAGLRTIVLADGGRARKLGSSFLARLRSDFPTAQLNQATQSHIQDDGLKSIQSSIPELIGAMAPQEYTDAILCSARRPTRRLRADQELKLFHEAWKQSLALRRIAAHDSSPVMKKAHLHGGANATYYFHTLEYLRAALVGQLPLFAPVPRAGSTLSTAVSPFISVLRDCISHEPILFAPKYLVNPGDVGYYSLNFPMISEPYPKIGSGYPPEMNSLANMIDELRQLPIGQEFVGLRLIAPKADKVRHKLVVGGVPSEGDVPELYALANGKGRRIDWGSGFLTAFIRCERST